MKPQMLVFIMFLVLFNGRLSHATTYVVNPAGTGDFPTIQAAIDAAVDGDTVQMTDGVFPYPPNVAIRFHGKSVTLKSQSGNSEACVLDGGGFNNASSAFGIGDGETEGCIISGLTIRRWGGGVGSGGGILVINGSSPRFENCRVIDNYTEIGGGFVISSGASPRFVNCLFAGNKTGNWGAGGVIQDAGPVVFERCVFSGNRSGQGDGGGGGGLFVAGGDVVTMIECTVTGNRALNSPFPLGAGGISAGFGASVLLERSILWGNCNGEALVAFGGSMTFDCCVVDSSEVVNYQGGGFITYSGNNLFLDPQFCGPIACDFFPPTILGDYTLNAASPALGALCGPVGAFGQGCGIISVDARSWGEIKGLYYVDPTGR